MINIYSYNINKLILLRWALVCFSTFFINSIGYSQIINIERYRINSDSTGLFGEINFNGNFINSSIDVLIVESNAILELKRKEDLFLFISNFNFIKSDNSRLVSEKLFHIRYNIKVEEWLRWEAFIQFQKNEILNIQHRLLIGTGPRFKIVDVKKLKIYLGSLVMYEDEIENIYPNIEHQNLRSSSYFSFLLKLWDKIDLSSTTYIQPLVSTINDIRILNQSRLKLDVNKHFSISIKYDRLYDSMPSTGIKSTNSTFTTGIGYRLR